MSTILDAALGDSTRGAVRRPGFIRFLVPRALVVVALGSVLWVTMGIWTLLITPIVAILWATTSPPVAFSLGQALVLSQLPRWVFWEGIAVELALGAVLLVSLVDGNHSDPTTQSRARRVKLAAVFAVTWVGLAAVGWLGSSLTGNVAIGATLLGVVSVGLAYWVYRVLSGSGVSNGGTSGD